ncbi:MAG: hypothetical protein IJJ59_10290 [Pseudobutyrivibrio sp.]|uniref:hypothetical protein n=1 Tax=Pseudobutyrivibrio sp. TaxID=2014367 RepID=UPI0025F67D58|nr:hypothetical protein [Pseudobutyrivibrio sp.]MBQ6463700.1 hypothetical protein [Pseudobutyrivibrio sp.]
MEVSAVRNAYAEKLEQIPDEYIQAFLYDYPLEEENLQKPFWGKLIRKRFDSNKRFGFDIGQMLNKPNCEESAAVVLENLDRVFLRTAQRKGEMFISCFSIVDFTENGLFHVHGNVGEDYTTLAKEEIDEQFKSNVKDALGGIINELEQKASPEAIPVYEATIMLMSKDRLIKKYYIHSVEKLDNVNDFIDMLKR